MNNIPLDHNPEPNNKEKAYLRPKPDKVDKGVENVRLKGWRFQGEDKNTVRIIIETYDKSKK